VWSGGARLVGLSGGGIQAEDLLGRVDAEGGECGAGRGVSVQVWVKLPAGPVKTPMCRSRRSSRTVFQVRPVLVSMKRTSSKASQHSSTWARMRASRQW
jgi:hypothetical protein